MVAQATAESYSTTGDGGNIWASNQCPDQSRPARLLADESLGWAPGRTVSSCAPMMAVFPGAVYRWWADEIANIFFTDNSHGWPGSHGKICLKFRWEELDSGPSGTTASLNSIQLRQRQVGLDSSDGGTILHSVEWRNHLDTVTSPAKGRIIRRLLHLSHEWFGRRCSWRRLAHDDEGRSWQFSERNTLKTGLKMSNFVDELHGLAVGSAGTILRQRMVAETGYALIET